VGGGERKVGVSISKDCEGGARRVLRASGTRNNVKRSERGRGEEESHLPPAPRREKRWERRRYHAEEDLKEDRKGKRKKEESSSTCRSFFSRKGGRERSKGPCKGQRYIVPKRERREKKPTKGGREEAKEKGKT